MPFTRVVNLIYLIRDYSPLPTFFAMLVLPFVLTPTADLHDIFNSITAKQRILLLWTQTLFFATRLASALRNYLTYRHLDLSLAANLYAQEWWSAPCKCSDMFSLARSLRLEHHVMYRSSFPIVFLLNNQRNPDSRHFGHVPKYNGRNITIPQYVTLC